MTALYRMKFTRLADPPSTKKSAPASERIQWEIENLVPEAQHPHHDQPLALLGMLLADVIVEPPFQQAMNELSTLHYKARDEPKSGSRPAYKQWLKALKKHLVTVIQESGIEGEKIRGWKGSYPGYKPGAKGVYTIVGRPGVLLSSWLADGETTAYAL